MNKASIISIGNEILNGQTVDTNTAYLSRQLLSIGIPVVNAHTVPDETGAIVRALNLASLDVDIILTTGGLGPTDDDLTRQGFSEFLGVELQLDDELLQKIESFFTSRNLKMPENNKIQAHIPAGAKALPNNSGTAPGIMAQINNILYFALPGVPSEMKQMFEESVLPQLRRLPARQAVEVRKLKCFGAGESTIAELLGPAMTRGRNPLINCTVKNGIISLDIVATAKNTKKAIEMADNDEKSLRNTLGRLIFGTAEQTLAEVVGQQLAQRKKTLAIAESCTGGTVARLLTDIPGASRYFTYGWITYSNNAKISELDIPADLIEKYGAVSEQVAAAMARAARTKAAADYAIGITGIAGPTGGNEQKPVGLVYISIDSDEGCETKKYIFSHDRSYVRLRAAQTALNMLRMKLKA